jgi:hypothetical protein
MYRLCTGLYTQYVAFASLTEFGIHVIVEPQQVTVTSVDTSRDVGPTGKEQDQKYEAKT